MTENNKIKRVQTSAANVRFGTMAGVARRQFGAYLEARHTARASVNPQAAITLSSSSGKQSALCKREKYRLRVRLNILCIGQ